MHRSGTSMLSRSIEELGVFKGINKDSNNESIHAIALNDWLLTNMGSRWDFPKRISTDLFSNKSQELTINYLTNQFYGAPSINFFGLSCNKLIISGSK